MAYVVRSRFRCSSGYQNNYKGIYSGTCRQKAIIASATPQSIRVMSNDGLIEFEDTIQGKQSLSQENMEDFVKGSPVNFAKNLEGNLLIIHGTADDNVHYQSAELLINELILHIFNTLKRLG